MEKFKKMENQQEPQHFENEITQNLIKFFEKYGWALDFSSLILQNSKFQMAKLLLGLISIRYNRNYLFNDKLAKKVEEIIERR